MPKATAVWLVDNTTLTFDQIAAFTGLHPLEVSGIADGEVAVGMKGFDPIANNQLTREEIARCESDPKQRLKIAHQVQAPKPKKKAPRYTPLSKRLDRPAAIAWIVRNHPEVEDKDICKLLGTTKTTIQAIRDKTHWNAQNIQPVDPVALGLCRQIDLDALVKKAADKKAANAAEAAATAEPAADATLLSPEESLRPTIKGFDGIDALSLEEEARAEGSDASKPADAVDPDSLFNLPSGDAEDEEEDADKR